MTPTFEDALKQLVADYGSDVFSRNTFNGLLKDYCNGKHGREIESLISLNAARSLQNTPLDAILRLVSPPVQAPVPSGLNLAGKTEIQRAEYRFQHIQGKLVIPKTVACIGYQAFAENEITEVVFEGSPYIENYAFCKNKINRISFTKPLPYISIAAFQENKLDKITIPQNLSVIELQLFADNELSRLTIPTGVKAIKPHAFNRNKLRQIQFSEGLRVIGNYAFSGNPLSEVSLPASLQRLDRYCFSFTNIRKIRIGANVVGARNMFYTDYDEKQRAFNECYYQKHQCAAGVYEYDEPENKWRKTAAFGT